MLFRHVSDNNPLSDLSFLSISFKSVASFLKLDLVFCREEVVKIMKYSSSISYFMLCDFVLYLKRHYHIQSHLGLLLYFFISLLIFFHFIYRYIINFELMFIKDVRLRFFVVCFLLLLFFMCGCPVISVTLLLYQRSIDYIYAVIFLDFLFCSIDLFA